MRSERVDAAGLTTSRVRSAQGVETIEHPDGLKTETHYVADARFGQSVKRVASARLTTPGGRTLNTLHSVRHETAEGDALLELASARETRSLNGATYVSSWDPLTRIAIQTSPSGRTVSVESDPYGRPTRLEAVGRLPLEYTYDASGRIETIVQGARRLSYAYDAAGHLDVELLEDTAAAQVLRRTEYDFSADGQLLGRRRGSPANVVSHRYDASGLMTALVAPGGATHAVSWSDAGLRRDYVAPDSTVIRYERDADYDVTSETVGGRLSVSYEYDAAGRMSRSLFSGRSVERTFDPATGQLATVTDSVGGAQASILSYSWDANLIRAETIVAGDVSWSVERDFDDRMRVTRRRVDGAHEIVLSYDLDGLLRSAGPVSLTWDAGSPDLRATKVGQVSTARTYDGFGQVESISTTVGANEALGIAISRDLSGRALEHLETGSLGAGTFSYAYDADDRLAGVSLDGLPIESYRIDARGNRIGVTRAGQTLMASYDQRDRVLSFGSRTYSWGAERSARGWTDSSSGEVIGLNHDALGGLRAVTSSTGADVSYVLDPTGRRVARLVNGTRTHAWAYKDGANPIAEYDGAGVLTARFIYASHAHVPDAMIKGGATYAFVHAPDGSVRAVIEAQTGAVMQHIEYGPFGRVLSDTNPGFQPFGFAGGLYDAETELVQLGVRTYDPFSGRWMNAEPAGFAGGSYNLYTYAYGDPVNYVDADGQLPFLVVFAAGALLSAAIDAAIQSYTKGCVNLGQLAFSAALGGIGSGVAGFISSRIVAALGVRAGIAAAYSSGALPGLAFDTVASMSAQIFTKSYSTAVAIGTNTALGASAAGLQSTTNNIAGGATGLHGDQGGIFEGTAQTAALGGAFGGIGTGLGAKASSFATQQVFGSRPAMTINNIANYAGTYLSSRTAAESFGRSVGDVVGMSLERLPAGIPIKKR